MDGDFVKAKWAQDAVASIETAVAQVNTTHPRAKPIRIVWGHRYQDEAREECREPLRYQQQNGLMAYRDLDIGLLITEGGDKSFPRHCQLRTQFPYHNLPLTAKELFNVIRSCQDGVSLAIMPDMLSPNIIVGGVETSIPVEGLTGRILYDALSRLSTSHSLVCNLLTCGEGDDWWSMNGGYAER